MGRGHDATLGDVTEGDCPTFVSDCNVRSAVELIDHLWDPVVLSALRRGPTRRSELLTAVNGISDKALTQVLRRLQARALVRRTQGIDPAMGRAAAIYGLSPLGDSFANGPLAHLARWAADHQDELAGTSTSA